MNRRLRQPPGPVLALFAVDATLMLVYLADQALGRPWGMWTNFVDLARESNLPTWYSSMQLAAVAVLFGMFGARNFRRSRRGSWALVLLPALCLLLSLDEVAQIHEGLGRKSDWLLPGGTRQGTAFHRTGIWIFAVGLPFLLVLFLILRSLSRWLRDAPGVARKLSLGFAILLGGALGVEALSNFLPGGSTESVLGTVFEETMEMAGATVLFWAGFELLNAPRNGIPRDDALVQTPPSAPEPPGSRADELGPHRRP